jgi:hypothetical protein
MAMARNRKRIPVGAPWALIVMAIVVIALIALLLR